MPAQLREVRALSETVAVLGAASLVGEPAVRRLVEGGATVLAYSRRPLAFADTRVVGRLLPSAPFEHADRWISVLPIGSLPEHFARIEASGATRIVQLSSTSQFTKTASSDPREAGEAANLVAGEAKLQAWAGARGIEWTILRPTLIYRAGHDHNVEEIARFIRRFGFFPLFGAADGRRQPVAAEDVAEAAVLASRSAAAANRAYEIAGGETLTYRAMVERIFASLHRRPVVPRLPLSAFRLALTGFRRLRRFRHWNEAMVRRMNTDMVFDISEAGRDFGFSPRGFAPGPFGV